MSAGSLFLATRPKGKGIKHLYIAKGT